MGRGRSQPRPGRVTVPADALQKYARDNGGTLEFTDAKVCITYVGPGGTPTLGEPLQVKISKQFNFLPILKIGTITIRGSSTMRIERFANNTGPTEYGFGSPFGACT